ncbi:MAG: tyrosine--tRNA ligase [Planctomycetaceae bacterium]|jgi:tyrosyl-tRNA synthetase|nr:tyrosine--tRNA ligase [Planctomycetaceae bacterium]
MRDIFSELKWRGLIHQTTDDVGLSGWLLEAVRTVYAGFDPTADSLHVGHLLPLMNLRRFQIAGHRPIALAGGATGTIGDPSGKSEERNLITKEQVEYNIKSIKNQILKFLHFDHSTTGALLVNNADWFSQFSYIDFLRDVGKHFSVNVMMAKDSVRLRLSNTDSGLSFTEFSYMLMQSYDFVYLRKTYGCELQIGGSDQWGNITMGCDFGRRVGGFQLHGITSPLVTRSDGKKMGKTETGAIWLDPAKTPPYQFYQYWINLDDADVENMLKIFTDLQQEEIKTVIDQHTKEPNKRIAQRRLADEFTRLVHGEEPLAAARHATDIFFGGEIANLNDNQLRSIFLDVQGKQLTRERLENGLPIIDALCECGLTTSKAEARRTIQQGGAYINNKQITDINIKLTPEYLASETIIVVRTGKKKYALLMFIP